ncbi:MAG: tetratricopeptide repeat-containing protein kinase family protein, partial [Myxococcota bacterium]
PAPSPPPATVADRGNAPAKVNHPNVLKVHEVGTHEGHVFLAMEYVPGGSLSELELPRRGPERLAVLLPHLRDSARGLLAIHEAGLVRGEFSAHDVLIGADGRSRIADHGRSGLLAVLGDGDQPPAVDPRSDQYDLCATYLELLYGDPSQAADAQSNDDAAAEFGPAWLVAVLRRGLQREPDQRFPSMRPLCAALEAGGVRKRRSLAPWATASLAMAAAGYAATRDEPKPSEPAEFCDDQRDALVQAWGPARREAVQAAFMATEQAAAVGAWDRVRHRLDAWTDAWAEAALESCEATRVRGTQTQRMFEVRAACQARQRDALDELTTEFLAATPESLFEAAGKAMQLPKVEHCADPDRLIFAGGTLDFTSPVITECHALSDRAKELSEQGRYAEAELYQREAAILATEHGALKIASWLYSNLALICLQTGDREEAEVNVRRQLELAERSGDGNSIVLAWLRMWMVLDEHTRAEEGAFALAQAEVLAEGFGVPETIRAQLVRARGRHLFVGGDPEEAARLYLQGAAMSEALGVEPIRVAIALTGASRALSAIGKTEASAAAARRSLEVHEEIFGPLHPKTLHVKAGLAKTLLKVDPKAALELSRFVHDNFPTDLMLRTRNTNVGWHGQILQANGLTAEAAEVYAAQADVVAKRWGDASREAIQMRANRGDALSGLERWEEAVLVYSDLVETIGSIERPNAELAAAAYIGYGRALASTGRDAEAVAMIEQGVAALEHAVGPNRELWTELLIRGGEVLERAGAGERAPALYARAAKLAETTAISDALREQLQGHIGSDVQGAGDGD